MIFINYPITKKEEDIIIKEFLEKVKGEKMSEMHKHKGVMNEGRLRSHPVSQVHKDKKVQKYHIEEVKKTLLDSRKKEVKKLSPAIPRPPVKKEVKATKITEVAFPLENGYVMIELNKIPINNNHNIKGAKVKFVTIEGRKRRTVGVQFEIQ